MTTDGSYEIEDQLLERIDLALRLARLDPAKRAFLDLAFMIRGRPDYVGWWPPKAEDIGRYLAATFPEFNGRPVPARTQRAWRERLIASLREEQ